MRNSEMHGENNVWGSDVGNENNMKGSDARNEVES